MRGATVSAGAAPTSRVRDVHLDDLYWIVRELLLDTPGRDRPRIVPAGLVRARRTNPPLLALDAAASEGSPAWRTDRRSAVAMLGYTVEALDVPVGRVADIMLDDARWTVRAISVRTHAGVLAIPVLAVAALVPAERRMVLRLDRKRLLRFRYPRAVEARL